MSSHFIMNHHPYIRVTKKSNGKELKGLISMTGEVVLPCEYYNIYFERNMISVTKEVGGDKHSYGIYSLKGEQIVPCQYAHIDRLTQENEPIQIFALQDEKYRTLSFVAIDAQGKVIVPFNKYQGIKKAAQNLYTIQQNGKWGLWSGDHEVLPCQYDEPIKFENDMRALSVIGKHRVNKFMSRLEGHKLWRIAEFYNEMMFRLPAVRQAESHSRNGGRVFMYYWIEPSALRYRGACHAVELAYVFGNHEETIYTGERADAELSRRVMAMWAQFARTGDPSTDEVTWQAYKVPERMTLVISKDIKLKNDVLKNQRTILSPLLKHSINPSYATLDYNVPFVRKAVGIAAVAAVTTVLGVIAVKKLLE